MKLLITGGCGFLGSNLAGHALNKGIELVIFDNLSRQGSVDNLQWLNKQGKFKFVHGDIRNANDVARIIKDVNPDSVFHVAGQVAMTTSIANPRMDFEINAMGTLNVLEAVRQYAPNAAVIYSSTNKVYGDLEQYSYKETDTRYVCLERPNGFDETTPLSFHSPYGCSKGSADQYMLDYARIFGLKTVVFRHSSMYGGRQFASYDQGWIGWFCQKAIEIKKGIAKEPFSISGNGKQVRDVLHSEDMISLYFSVLSEIDKVRGNVFNIGGGMCNSLSLIELFKALSEINGVEMNFVQLPPRASDQKIFISDITKVTKALSWQPVVDAKHGIVKMCEWVDHIESKKTNKTIA